MQEWKKFPCCPTGIIEAPAKFIVASTLQQILSHSEKVTLIFSIPSSGSLVYLEEGSSTSEAIFCFLGEGISLVEFYLFWPPIVISHSGSSKSKPPTSTTSTWVWLRETSFRARLWLFSASLEKEAWLFLSFSFISIFLSSSEDRTTNFLPVGKPK